MILLSDAAPQDLTGALMVACGGLVTAVGILFWQLIAAKNETTALAKELMPIATNLLAAAQSMQKMVEKKEQA